MAGEQVQGDAQPAEVSPPQISSDEAQESLGKMAIMDEAAPEGGAEATEDIVETPKETKPDEAEAKDEETSDAEAENGADTEDEEEGQTEAKHDSPRAEKRIAKLTAQREEFREKFEAAEVKVKELEAKTAESVGLHPDYLKPEEHKLITEANAMESRREFLLRHIGRGYDDPKNTDRSMSAEQVAEELVLVEKQASRIAKANAIYEERKQQMLDDMRAGRQLRLSKAKLAKPVASKPVATATRPSAATSTPVNSKAQRQGIDLDRFAKNGADKDAAARELAELAG
jgi:hypothetical protein